MIDAKTEFDLQRLLIAEIQQRGYHARLTGGSGDTDVELFDLSSNKTIGFIEVKLQPFGTSKFYEALGQVIYHRIRRNPVPPLAICGGAGEGSLNLAADMRLAKLGVSASSPAKVGPDCTTFLNASMGSIRSYRYEMT